MEQRVTFPRGSAPSWEALRDLLAARGFAVQLMMIDGELSFPDETPPPAWREVRVGTPGGMVTLRREADAVLCVTWGNADAPMRRAWNALAWALAEAGAGVVETPSGPRMPDEFLREAELPEVLKA
jgi:hypothetical protein